jgi:hypothetical protein
MLLTHPLSSVSTPVVYCIHCLLPVSVNKGLHTAAQWELVTLIIEQFRAPWCHLKYLVRKPLLGELHHAEQVDSFSPGMFTFFALE